MFAFTYMLYYCPNMLFFLLLHPPLLPVTTFCYAAAAYAITIFTYATPSMLFHIRHADVISRYFIIAAFRCDADISFHQRHFLSCLLAFLFAR